MLHGENRFFTNYQMSKEVSSSLWKADTDKVNNILNQWLESTGIYQRI
jgi:hypothetical protein